MTVTPTKTKPVKHGDKLYKYWTQRYNLFSKFDKGILLDDVSWYSVTPESIASHIAERVIEPFKDGYIVIVDGFCGVGGNLIQFAYKSPNVRVIGCDIDQDRIRMAKHNAKIYGVENQCEFILGDFMNIIPSLKKYKIDAVFLSPPWGGVDYMNIENYSLNNMTPNGYDVVRLCRRHLTKNIAFLMPRNVDLQELRKKLLDRHNALFECEHNMIGNKIKTITVYFGDLVDPTSETDSDEG